MVGKMKRYHKKIYFPDIELLKRFNDNINSLTWQYSKHCLTNLKYRHLDIKALLLYLKGLVLDDKDIFEYYIENKKISKVCYRITYIKNIDIILVVSETKNIITIYSNLADDKHTTLKEELYIRK